jgi:hypothetical protein
VHQLEKVVATYKRTLFRKIRHEFLFSMAAWAEHFFFHKQFSAFLINNTPKERIAKMYKFK